MTQSSETIACQHPPLWSFALLKRMAERKQVQVKENAQLTRLRSFALFCGEKTIITLRASLPDATKRLLLAQHLAHLALGHNELYSGGEDLQIRQRHPREHPLKERYEQEALAWAVQLLVGPERCDPLLLEPSKASEPFAHTHPAHERVLARAVRRTAQQLKLTPKIIELWLQYRDYVFPVAPRLWLQQTPPPAEPELESSADLHAWVQEFIQDYRIMSFARDYWIEQSEIRQRADLAEHWKGTPISEEICCRRCDLGRLLPGLERYGWGWEVILWHHHRRWYTVVGGDTENLEVIYASWDHRAWPSLLPPWNGQEYDQWERTHEAFQMGPIGAAARLSHEVESIIRAAWMHPPTLPDAPDSERGDTGGLLGRLPASST